MPMYLFRKHYISPNPSNYNQFYVDNCNKVKYRLKNGREAYGCLISSEQPKSDSPYIIFENLGEIDYWMPNEKPTINNSEFRLEIPIFQLTENEIKMEKIKEEMRGCEKNKKRYSKSKSKSKFSRALKKAQHPYKDFKRNNQSRM